MRIAVVILNWNGKGLLESYLPAVMSYSEGAEIYVADNASSDDSVAFITENYPSIKIIQKHCPLAISTLMKETQLGVCPIA